MLEFRTVASRDLLIIHTADGGPTETIVNGGERFVPPPLSPAWFNRLGRTYLALDTHPQDVRWTVPGILQLQFLNRDGLLLLYCEGSYLVLEPQSDSLAFSRNLGQRVPAKVEIVTMNGSERVCFSGGGATVYSPVTNAALLVDGDAIGGSLIGGQTRWFRFDSAPGLSRGVRLKNTITGTQLRVFHSDYSVFPLAELGGNGVAGFQTIASGAYYVALYNASNGPFSLNLYSLRIQSLQMIGNEVVLTWSSQPGAVYWVEWTPTLDSQPKFQKLFDVPSSGTRTSWRGSLPAANAAFLRVVETQ